MMPITKIPPCPQDVAKEDWNHLNRRFCEAARLDISEIETFASYYFWEVLPVVDIRDPKVLNPLGIKWIEPPLYLKRYGNYYGHWVLSDGRIARSNTWGSQVTIFPKE